MGAWISDAPPGDGEIVLVHGLPDSGSGRPVSRGPQAAQYKHKNVGSGENVVNQFAMDIG